MILCIEIEFHYLIDVIMIRYHFDEEVGEENNI